MSDRLIREIDMNGNKFRILKLTNTGGIPCCIADWLYKCEWHELKNIDTRIKIRKLYDCAAKGRVNG